MVLNTEPPDKGIEEVVCRQPLSVPPLKSGSPNEGVYREFEIQLMRKGWLDNDGRIVKRFNVERTAHFEPGNYYVEYRAVLTQSTPLTPYAETDFHGE